MNLINSRHKHNGTHIFSSPFSSTAFRAMPGNTSSVIEEKDRSENRFYVAVPKTREVDASIIKSIIGEDNKKQLDAELLRRA